MATGYCLNAIVHCRTSLVAGIIGGGFLGGGRDNLVHDSHGFDMGLIVVGDVAGGRLNVGVAHQLSNYRQIDPVRPQRGAKGVTTTIWSFGLQSCSSRSFFQSAAEDITRVGLAIAVQKNKF